MLSQQFVSVYESNIVQEMVPALNNALFILTRFAKYKNGQHTLSQNSPNFSVAENVKFCELRAPCYTA